MLPTRVGEAFEDTVQLTVLGERLSTGMRAPDFELDAFPPGAASPHPVTLQDSVGSIRLLNVINSIDTPVCHVETCRWEQLRPQLPSGVRLYTISMDLPFALARWRSAESVAHEFLSAHRSERFGLDYGVLLQEWRLLQRAVFVIDAADQIAYAEYVADQMREPNYEAALAVVRQMVSP
jgi:thioredoxin-dependent peroxiredoxin